MDKNLTTNEKNPKKDNSFIEEKIVLFIDEHMWHGRDFNSSYRIILEYKDSCANSIKFAKGTRYGSTRDVRTDNLDDIINTIIKKSNCELLEKQKDIIKDKYKEYLIEAMTKEDLAETSKDFQQLLSDKEKIINKKKNLIRTIKEAQEALEEVEKHEHNVSSKIELSIKAKAQEQKLRKLLKNTGLL